MKTKCCDHWVDDSWDTRGFKFCPYCGMILVLVGGD